MAQKEIKDWITVNHQHIPIFEGQSKQDAINKAKKHQKSVNDDEDKKQKQIAENKKQADKKNNEEKGISDYGLTHRPGNPLEYPDEVATVDKILNGDYFPKDLLDNARDYFPDYGNFKGADQIIQTLRKAQNNPDMKVIIYRGAPSGGTLNQGDWVTLSKDYASDYAADGNYGDNANSKVYSYKVKAKELSFDGDSIYEFGYWGKKKKPD